MSESFKHVIREIYCDVLFELAEESDQVDDIMADIDLVASVLSEEPDFAALLTSDVIKGAEKAQVFRRIFTDRINPLALDFLCVLAKRNRMKFLTSIADGLEVLVDGHHGRSLVEVTLPSEPSKAKLEEIRSDLSKALGGKVKMNVHVDPSIVGGIIIKKGDKTIDNSVKRILDTAVKTVVEKSKDAERQSRQKTDVRS